MKKTLLSVCIATLLSGASTIVSALGIAEPTLYSLLGQKLDCDLELISMDDLTADELVVSIAPPATGSVPGRINVSVVKRGDGKTVVKLRSAEVINEPYLEFTVVLRWPQGQLQRDVTLLLDTPANR